MGQEGLGDELTIAELLLLLAWRRRGGAARGLRWIQRQRRRSRRRIRGRRATANGANILTRAQYEVLRMHRTETARFEPAQLRETQRHLCLCGLRAATVLVGDEVRQQDRVAVLRGRCANALGTATDHVLRVPRTRCIAAAAAAISATSSRTGRRRPGCAIASTASR